MSFWPAIELIYFLKRLFESLFPFTVNPSIHKVLDKQPKTFIWPCPIEKYISRSLKSEVKRKIGCHIVSTQSFEKPNQAHQKPCYFHILARTSPQEIRESQSPTLALSKVQLGPPVSMLTPPDDLQEGTRHTSDQIQPLVNLTDRDSLTFCLNRLTLEASNLHSHQLSTCVALLACFRQCVIRLQVLIHKQVNIRPLSVHSSRLIS